MYPFKESNMKSSLKLIQILLQLIHFEFKYPVNVLISHSNSLKLPVANPLITFETLVSLLISDRKLPLYIHQSPVGAVRTTLALASPDKEYYSRKQKAPDSDLWIVLSHDDVVSNMNKKFLTKSINT